ncbi:ATP citrate lyase citrate-binding domain-containing protein [Candidatus Magnetaquicoccus inordinatus]|uniref:ATP citrate lyase citrate-binding domain-containing protein n=1 Tax=Candidatus Magnetaquicoccus inordinatus TaxID=2496818 RepID=UPI00102C1C76|nr:ATP citrate lyase citrate-binding domain-containing protein [Candidatus Magnetaquicoccus inordinatus]
MQITGMKWGAKLLKYVDFPTAEVLGAEATPEEIQALIDKYGGVLVKPVFKGGIGKKGKAGLVGKATDVRTALKEKERLYFVEHRHGNSVAKSEGVTYESFIKADYEVYVSLTDSTIFRAPTLTITHHGGVDIEELPPEKIASVPFDPLTGLKGFVISNALQKLGAPNEIISPLVQNLTKLWDLFHNYGMTTLELNPIRVSRDANGRLTPIACDFKCSFDGDDRNSKRLFLPEDLENTDLSEYELEVNQLRTYQGQSDVFVINPTGTVTAMTFGGGANALVTELLGDRATISSDFGGNPPYAKMKEISRITYKHWLPQTNVLFIIGGKANNTDIYETFRAMADALREYFAERGPTPLFVVVGRGGPNLVRGMGYLRDVMDSLGLPYAMFGFDSAMSEVINYAMAADEWMANGGRQIIAQKMGIR